MQISANLNQKTISTKHPRCDFGFYQIILTFWLHPTFGSQKSKGRKKIGIPFSQMHFRLITPLSIFDTTNYNLLNNTLFQKAETFLKIILMFRHLLI